MHIHKNTFFLFTHFFILFFINSAEQEVTWNMITSIQPTNEEESFKNSSLFLNTQPVCYASYKITLTEPNNAFRIEEKIENEKTCFTLCESYMTSEQFKKLRTFSHESVCRQFSMTEQIPDQNGNIETIKSITLKLPKTFTISHIKGIHTNTEENQPHINNSNNTNQCVILLGYKSIELYFKKNSAPTSSTTLS